MTTIGNILNRLKGLWWRMAGRSRTPVVIRRVDAGDWSQQKRRRSGVRPEAQEGDPGMGAERAAEEIFAPSHGEEDSYGFSRVGQDGTVPHRGELWDRENNSMRVRRRRVMLITCSGGVVPSPEEIKAVCSECGGVDSVAHRCARCGATLCQLHAHVLHHPTGPVLYCRTHLEEAIDDWDTWEAFDVQHGMQPAKSIFPERPWAAAKFTQRGGNDNA